MNYIVEMNDINKFFPGVQALSNAQLKLEKGEVLGLIGENGAGKSTLMNILSGVFPQDSGDIIINDKKVKFQSPNDALMSGISMIHQELCLVPEMTVAENIWIGREDKFTNLNIINKKKMQQAAQNLMSKYNIDLDCKRTVSSLSISEMQLVEIIRAISFDSNVIIMDEPTSTLTAREVEILFNIIHVLKKNGVSIIFISHKMDELFNICDRITVMRDSKYIDTLITSETNPDELISMMVGRKINNLFPKREPKIGEVVLELKSFTREGVFDNVNLQLHKGEVLGISGLVGAGRSEIVRSLFGIDKPTSGEVYIDGKKVTINSPEDAINNGIAMVTEDRALSGLILGVPIRHNITIVILKMLCKAGFINKKKDDSACDEMIKKLNIKTSSKQQLAGQLSGGNQQKVVLAKWLLRHPKVLILDEPTRGIDVGSKSEIYKLINDLANQGISILMISSELPEVLGMSDRILVLREGKITYECNRDEATQEKIMEYAFGN